MKRTHLLALLVAALLLGGGYHFASAQGGGGAFVPSFAYDGIRNFPRFFACGAGTGNHSCANTASGMTAHIITGTATLSNGSAVVSGISPPFTSTTTGACIGQSQDAASGTSTTVQVVITGVSSIRVEASGAEVIWYQCVAY